MSVDPVKTPHRRICPNPDFPALGSEFPHTADLTLPKVKDNLAYAVKEIVRFERSTAVICRVDTQAHTQAIYVLTILDILAHQLDETNKDKINALLPVIFPPLTPWTGAILDSLQELIDLHYTVHQSALALTGPLLHDIGISHLTSAQIADLKTTHESALSILQKRDKSDERSKAIDARYPRPRESGIGQLGRALRRALSSKKTPTAGSVVTSGPEK